MTLAETEEKRDINVNFLIDDRFQILRDLIPHSDQKRDRATFLLEVIVFSL